MDASEYIDGTPLALVQAVICVINLEYSNIQVDLRKPALCGRDFRNPGGYRITFTFGGSGGIHP